MKFIRPLRVDDDNDEEALDGETIHVRLDTMDGVPRTFNARDYQPGFRRMTDADATLRRASYESFKHQLSNAWRNPGGTPYGVSASDAAKSTDDRHSARDQYIKRLGDAWRTAGRVQSTLDVDPTKPDPNVANAIQRQQEQWQGRDPVDIARDVERRRRAAHAEYCNTLSNAWRSGR